MPLDTGNRPNRSGSNQDLWPKWMWVAVPVLVVVVVAGLWWAIFSDAGLSEETATPTPTVKPLPAQPTQAPTLVKTLPAPVQSTPTAMILPTLPTFTPTTVVVTTPTVERSAETQGGMVKGAKLKVVGTGKLGLNMRSNAGTTHARVKTLPEGSVVEIVGESPIEANGFTWYQIRDEAGTTGWVAGRFLSE